MDILARIDRLCRGAAELWGRLKRLQPSGSLAPHDSSLQPDHASQKDIAAERRAPRDVDKPKLALGLLPKIADFGSNPGELIMRVFVPANPSRMRPLVVVLHGCGQTVDGYDAASGWSRLADQHDFVLLYPEQREANNPQRCFSWFEPGDTRRGAGEVESIRQMVAAAIATFGADPTRVYICGLSAGGAMTGAALAAYPEVFSGGAIVAGLPYGTASNVSEAYESMSTGKIKEAKAWGDLVRAASTHRGPWPSVSIWHGMEDNVVKPINAGELIKQWTNVHEIGASVPDEDRIGLTVRRAWLDRKHRPLVIEYCVPGLKHGMPVDNRDPPAPFFLPAGISATWQIADDWGLTRRGRPSTIRAIFGGEAAPTGPLAEPTSTALRALRPG